uniref:Uncharacterized protein n=1 Tax=Anguilla anguilla TaxID=7936 RepID=A0A0E9PFK8_ANGAN
MNPPDCLPSRQIMNHHGVIKENEWVLRVAL